MHYAMRMLRRNIYIIIDMLCWQCGWYDIYKKKIKKKKNEGFFSIFAPFRPETGQFQFQFCSAISMFYDPTARCHLRSVSQLYFYTCSLRESHECESDNTRRQL